MKYYYAAFFPAGVGVETSDDELFRFESEYERDDFAKFIDGLSPELGHSRMKAVTEQDAGARFDLAGFDSPHRVVRTCAGNPVPSVKRRKSA